MQGDIERRGYVCETLKVSKGLLSRPTAKPSSVVFDPNWQPIQAAWWRRILLLFKRTRISIDLGHGQDYGAKCYYKQLGGKIHIVRWETIERGNEG